MVTTCFENFELPSKKFLAALLQMKNNHLIFLKNRK